MNRMRYISANAIGQLPPVGAGGPFYMIPPPDAFKPPPAINALADIGTGFVPGVGDARDVAELVTGKNAVTLEPLNKLDYILTAMGAALPWLGGSVLRGGGRAADAILEGIDEAVEYMPVGNLWIPPHSVQDEALFESLKNNMAEKGWQGRPLLMIDADTDNPRALTGSHRAAAVEALNRERLSAGEEGIEIPYYGWDFTGFAQDMVDKGEIDDVYEAAKYLDDLSDVDVLADLIEAHGGDPWAVKLLRAERLMNEAADYKGHYR